MSPETNGVRQRVPIPIRRLRAMPPPQPLTWRARLGLLLVGLVVLGAAFVVIALVLVGLFVLAQLGLELVRLWRR